MSADECAGQREADDRALPFEMSHAFMRGEREVLLTAWGSHPRTPDLLRALDAVPAAMGRELVPAEERIWGSFVAGDPWLNAMWDGKLLGDPRKLLYGAARRLIEAGATRPQAHAVATLLAVRRGWPAEVAASATAAAWRAGL